MTNFPLTSLSTDWGVSLNINHLSDDLSVLCEYSYREKTFRIIDLYQDEIVNTIKFPEEIEKIGSISIADTNNFAFITDTIFYVYKNEQFFKYNYSEFMDDYIPLNYINIIYLPEDDKIISGALTYNNKGEIYSSFFLNVYDLKEKTSSIIPFSYPPLNFIVEI